MRTPPTKQKLQPIVGTLPALETTSLVSGAELPAATDSLSLSDVLNTEALKMGWVNSVRHQVSKQLLFLRKARKLSQAEVARRAGTSQPKVARIESGEENITLDTLEKHVAALNGRFMLSIYPRDRSRDRS